jgi:uncharacterized protein
MSRGSQPPESPGGDRPYPVSNLDDHAFWTGGEHGQLLINRCHACGRWQHPPVPVCPRCHSRDVAAEPVSGRGRVVTYTINHQPWFESMPPPYVIAIIELEEQVDLRLTSNVIECVVDDVTIGMPVQVEFLALEDVWLPQFVPASPR